VFASDALYAGAIPRNDSAGPGQTHTPASAAATDPANG
jgi:hypothetical protein